ncbi:MAG: hypothetical protein QOH04_753 [Sphingomonadales bacterium]|jgi:hypothetical protein|nr:hypothetical protein [Sphingomonadales bacterium]
MQSMVEGQTAPLAPPPPSAVPLPMELRSTGRTRIDQAKAATSAGLSTITIPTRLTTQASVRR